MRNIIVIIIITKNCQNLVLSGEMCFKCSAVRDWNLMMIKLLWIIIFTRYLVPGRVAQSVGHLTRKSGVLGSKPGLATYFRFSFRFFKKGSCQLLAKVCARSTG